MSSDDDRPMNRAFVVQETGEEFDLDIPPTSGLEYLRRVRKEAEHCPSIVVANIDVAAFHHKQTVKVQQTSGLHPAPVGLSPDIQWQRLQAANFSDVRQHLTRHKARLMKEGHKKTRKGIKLPPKDNTEEWCQLCFGHIKVQRTSAISDTGSSAKDTSSQPASTNGLNEAQSVDKGLFRGGMPPLLSIVSQMDQNTVLQVLEYHVNWFEATGFSEQQGRWFYALMACLEKPLDPEACSLLRSVARNCANLRATLETKEDPRLVPLNLLICLVARYFDQTDLADDG